MWEQQQQQQQQQQPREATSLIQTHTSIHGTPEYMICITWGTEHANTALKTNGRSQPCQGLHRIYQPHLAAAAAGSSDVFTTWWYYTPAICIIHARSLHDIPSGRVGYYGHQILVSLLYVPADVAAILPLLYLTDRYRRCTFFAPAHSKQQYMSGCT